MNPEAEDAEFFQAIVQPLANVANRILTIANKIYESQGGE